MPYTALLPAALLVTGVLLGSSWPKTWVPVFSSSLVLCWVAAFIGCCLKRPLVLLVFGSIGFLAIGILLSISAGDAAFQPPLRSQLERRGLRDPPTPPRELVVPLLFEGTIREDASIGPSGARLCVTVDRVWIDRQPRDTAGGVLLSVSGDSARQHVGEWREGRRIRFPAAVRRPARYLNAGVPDGERALAWKGITLTGTIKSATLVDRIRDGNWLSEFFGAARQLVRQAVRRHIGCWSERSSAIVTAILIGDRAGLDEQTERALQDAGTYHVLAISGGNIAVLAGLLILTHRVFRLRPWANLLVAVVLAGYAELAGAGASVRRATIMAVTCFAARVWDLGAPVINALAISVVIIVVWTPLAIHDLGFVLSFGATIGILSGAAVLRGWMPESRWSRAAWSLLVASLSAEMALLPIGAWAFSRVTFAGIVLNFAAIPLMALAQLAGLLVLALAPAHDALARAAGFVAHGAAAGLVESTVLIEWLPQIVLRTPPPSALTIATYYIGLVTWLACWTLRRVKGSSVGPQIVVTQRIGVVSFAASLIWILIAPAEISARSHPRLLIVRFLDVGQGDSAAIHFPDRRSLLVDTGGSATSGAFDIGARVLAPALWSAGFRRLDYLAITHGDPDHIGGARSIVRDFRPLEIWQGIPVPRHAPTEALWRQARDTRTAWRTLVAGDAIQMGEAWLGVLHPPLPDWERPAVRNDDSLVLETRLGDVSVLLTGDIGTTVERGLIAVVRPARIRVLKVPHHGSATSSSEDFLKAVAPSVAVFSVGRNNRYGHPHPDILDRYRRHGVSIFRTDQDGAVTVETDGRRVEITTFTGRRLSIGPG